MKNHIMGTDHKCWKIVKDGPLSIDETDDKENNSTKKESDFSCADFKKLEKNSKAKGIVDCEVNIILA